MSCNAGYPPTAIIRVGRRETEKCAEIGGGGLTNKREELADIPSEIKALFCWRVFLMAGAAPSCRFQPPHRTTVQQPH